MENINKKKLIGTIIGVLAFTILMASATFAWLTFTANVTNGIYNAGTMNFMVDYTRGTDVDSIPILSGTEFLTSEITPLSVIAKKTSGSANGILYIKLYTDVDSDSATIAEAEILNYAVCVGNECITTQNDATYIDISLASSADVISTTGDTVIFSEDLQSTDTTYNIYLWIDNENMDNSTVGLNYTGYIHATATQSDIS